jgi:hypothetical protein
MDPINNIKRTFGRDITNANIPKVNLNNNENNKENFKKPQIITRRRTHSMYEPQFIQINPQAHNICPIPMEQSNFVEIRPNLNDSNLNMLYGNSSMSKKEQTQRRSDIFTLRLPLFSHFYNPVPEFEYIDDIFINLQLEEIQTRPLFDYMKEQPELNEKMRTIMVEWLVDIHQKFNLKIETLFLAIDIIDRYLMIKRLKRANFQLLGATSIFLASKYEEIYYPEIRDIIYICDRLYDKNDILNMEFEILNSIVYTIMPISPLIFVQLIFQSLRNNLSNFDYYFCCLMAELSLFDYKMLKFVPSLIACTGFYITLKIKKKSNCDAYSIIYPYINKISNNYENDLKECAHGLCFLLDNLGMPCFKEIKEKYSKKEYCEVSNFQLFF